MTASLSTLNSKKNLSIETYSDAKKAYRSGNYHGCIAFLVLHKEDFSPTFQNKIQSLLLQKRQIENPERLANRLLLLCQGNEPSESAQNRSKKLSSVAPLQDSQPKGETVPSEIRKDASEKALGLVPYVKQDSPSLDRNTDLKERVVEVEIPTLLEQCDEDIFESNVIRALIIKRYKVDVPVDKVPGILFSKEIRTLPANAFTTAIVPYKNPPDRGIDTYQTYFRRVEAHFKLPPLPEEKLKELEGIFNSVKEGLEGRYWKAMRWKVWGAIKIEAGLVEPKPDASGALVPIFTGVKLMAAGETASQTLDRLFPPTRPRSNASNLLMPPQSQELKRDDDHAVLSPPNPALLETLADLTSKISKLQASLSALKAPPAPASPLIQPVQAAPDLNGLIKEFVKDKIKIHEIIANLSMFSLEQIESFCDFLIQENDTKSIQLLSEKLSPGEKKNLVMKYIKAFSDLDKVSHNSVYATAYPAGGKSKGDMYSVLRIAFVGCDEDKIKRLISAIPRNEFEWQKILCLLCDHPDGRNQKAVKASAPAQISETAVNKVRRLIKEDLCEEDVLVVLDGIIAFFKPI